MKVLVTGGARSGKSTFAEQLAMRLSDQGIYIATSRIWDTEMEQRVEIHRRQRSESGFSWETVEEPLALAERLTELKRRPDIRSGRAPAVLVDCLTLWLTNHLLEEEKEEEKEQPAQSEERAEAEEAEEANSQAAGLRGSLESAMNDLEEAAADFPSPIIFVTNEVGSGIVPAYPLGRRFRDEAGRMNQRMAQLCERKFWVVSGVPVDLNKVSFAWEDL
ncbi:bifunctional adenosylcobinamide kinase/adenosylcobinamide-phosphate guanylyltransferase [Paenibacillus beijingensis]|uniref:Adenosylcobinamide kinase n=1 Tax=Paenibacillus beijingensis TaxID=1126833 RepID=A0A0D5NNT8_9BACL|nr:bifunctional adenosylcobinamide kinase/adenosylcobinamide-phosphate guanylyltransferase [Paenibacillus beijingensis]AJY76657.1 adenosylcobinamide-phosphate guanylyltransferase [Paenibacillus beijingensis]